MEGETLTTPKTAPRYLPAVSLHPRRLLSLFLVLGTSVAAGWNLSQGGAGLPRLLASHVHRNTSGQTPNIHLQTRNIFSLN
jgi:hypothetical protein